MEFKETLRAVDVLMIDDLQFLIGKDNTQEEFFHTFNALVDQGKQIVVSSDKPPSDLAYSAPSETGDAEVKGTPASNADDPYAGVSRNADCPCGSGKKYKKCHGAPGGPTGMTTRAGG